MKKVILLSCAVALLSSTAIAAEIHALTAIQTTPTPLQDMELSAIEGGSICNFQTAGSVSLCDVVVAWPFSKVTSDAFFAADFGLPLSSGQFLQVIK